MQRALDTTPVWLSGPGREHWEALQGMGLATLADLRRLPRSGLARRFGPAMLADLDRAYGERPDPRVPIKLPPQFESRLELSAPTAPSRCCAAGMLLARLAAWLAAQHAFVRGFVLAMQREPRWRSDAQVPAQTLLAVSLAEPSRDAAHLQVLLRERLAQLRLPAPTLELRLAAREIVPGEARPAASCSPARRASASLVRLVERLQARLGAEHVQRLRAVHDHRPECASATRPVDAARVGQRGASVVVPPTPLRPVWLLAPPEPLPERAAQPLLAGRALQLLSGPGRIEAGWWDHALAERDYFIAEDAEGALDVDLPRSAARPR